MRATVVHDLQGNIASVAVSPPDSGVMYLTPGPGQLVTEIAARALPADSEVAAIRAGMSALIETHRVDLSVTEARVLNKADATA